MELEYTDSFVLFFFGLFPVSLDIVIARYKNFSKREQQKPEHVLWGKYPVDGSNTVSFFSLLVQYGTENCVIKQLPYIVTLKVKCRKDPSHYGHGKR